MEPDGRGLEVDLLIEVLLQVHDAVAAEALNRRSGSGVERDEPVSLRHVQDSLLLAVAPVREAASGELARRRRPAGAFVLAVHPQQLAGRRVERDHGAPRPARRVQAAADHQRRRLEVELGPWTE